MDSHHLTTSEAFRRKIEEMFFQSIPLFLFPVLIWGKRWERILALLLSFIPLANLFVLLIEGDKRRWRLLCGRKRIVVWAGARC